ncbi:MAG: PEP-CTERM sorting domain-containing protein [Crocosphaera sp.]|nr:PEP-CTERM sorting domain-containing protein [Crocosphaera sp.]
MNPPKLLKALAIAGIAAAGFAVPMKANGAGFVIDDYNVTDLREAPPTNTDVSKTIINGDIWPEDWDRVELDAVTVNGDPVEARLCPNCGAFEMISGAGNSQGIAWVDYEGPEFDLSVYDGWWVLYSADLDGGDLALLTDSNNDGTFDLTLAEAIDLPNTGGAGPEFLEALKLDWLTDDLTVDDLRVQIDGTGVGNLDFTVDGVKKAPEPGTILGLLAVGSLSVAAKRKKQK